MPNPTTDFSIFDALELVTYDPATGPAISNVRAVRRPLTQSRMRNIETFVALQATDFVYHLDAGPLSSATLKAGDTITDAQSQIHSVLFVERQTLANTVATVCRPPAA